MEAPIAVVAARRQLADDWMRSLGIDPKSYIVISEAKQLRGHDPFLVFFYDFDWGHSQADRDIIYQLVAKAWYVSEMRQHMKDLMKKNEDLIERLNRKPWYRRIFASSDS